MLARRILSNAMGRDSNVEINAKLNQQSLSDISRGEKLTFRFWGKFSSMVILAATHELMNAERILG